MENNSTFLKKLQGNRISIKKFIQSYSICVSNKVKIINADR